MKSFLVIALVFGCALGAQLGIRNADNAPTDHESESYIIKGQDALNGRYPYMLSQRFEKTNAHFCGASILTKYWALTTGYCCRGPVISVLYSGSNLLSKGGNKHEIEKKIIHENISPLDHWQNNICLIKVKDPFVFGNRVQQITLPKQNMEVKHGDRVTFIGWGYTSPTGGKISDKLQVGRNFVVLSPEECYKRTNKKHKSFLCIVGARTGQGICDEDFGGPLLRNGVLVGIASTFDLPCASGTPDFFTRVPIFIDWIKETLGEDASELKFVK